MDKKQEILEKFRELLKEAMEVGMEAEDLVAFIYQNEPKK